MDTTPTDPENSTADQADDFRAQVISKLGLVPDGEGNQITDEAIFLALDGALSTAARVPELETTGTDAASRLQSLQQQYDEASAALSAKSDELAGIYRQQNEAQADAILEQYADRITTPEMKDRLRALLLSDRESAMDILKGLPAPVATTAKDEVPPPMHGPGSESEQKGSGPSNAELSQEITAEAKALQKKDKNLSWAEAWSRAQKTITAKNAA